MLIIKIILTILILFIPIKYLYKNIYNISNIADKAIKVRVIGGMIYLLILALFINVLFFLLFYIWL
jgi:hypothetical protein